MDDNASRFDVYMYDTVEDRTIIIENRSRDTFGNI